jgi:ribosomal protein S18 acetylase RimI-like enzyme
MPPKIIKKISRNIRDFGPGVFLKKMLSSGLKPLFEIRTYHIYLIDLRNIVIKASVPPDDIIIRFVAPEETAVIRQIEEMEEWLCGRVAEKLRGGQKCLVAMRGEEVAGFNLVSLDVFHLPNVWLSKPLRPKECSSEQITVHHKFRGRGLGTDLRNTFFSAMKKDGYTRIYGGTEATNTANRALTRKVGFNIFAEARYISFLGHKRLRISRLKK